MITITYLRKSPAEIEVAGVRCVWVQHQVLLASWPLKVVALHRLLDGQLGIRILSGSKDALEVELRTGQAADAGRGLSDIVVHY